MTELKEIREVPPEQLRWTCDPQQFEFETTAELPYSDVIIGQERAVEAIRFGLDIESPGFNVFVMGPVGSGRRSILMRLVREQAAQAPTPDDWVYVNHFADPRTPRAIQLPAGQGAQLRADMERFNAELVERLQRAFEQDQYANAREKLEQEWRTAQQQALQNVEEACRQRGFALVQSPSGLYIAPLRDGKPLDMELFGQLPPEERVQLEQDLDHLEEMLETALRRLREHERQAAAAIKKLDQEVSAFAIRPLMEELRTKYAEQAEVQDYLAEMERDIVENVNSLLGNKSDEDDGDPGSLLNVPLTQRYRVNVLVDHSHTQGAPVIVEESPTYDKLFGRIEYDVRYGNTTTDYTLIRPGALHHANGGYLILDAATLLSAPYVWEGLKRALFTGTIRMESPDGQQLVRTVTPEPEPIPLQVKVILRGEPYIYYSLYDRSDDFTKLFKVLADFDSEMPRTPETERAYAQFLRALGEDEHLLPFTAGAVARVVEFGVRQTEDQQRLSAQFGQIADLAREAAYLARKAHHSAVQREDVLSALQQRIRRVNLETEWTQREILENRLFIQTEGRVVGQINGLMVITRGGYSYGIPNRITARVYAGRGNVLDIQREIHLDGPSYGKGVLTLNGYFGGQYGTHEALAMEASLSIEQMYNEVDGDSASSAELYALISALAQVPLRQDLAVTGSVDQFGHIQPIGGVNEKIEGFFTVCRMRGLTGSQGVIIPAANKFSLMLSEEVITAVRAGQFHIYAVTTVDEGLELFTDIPAGQPDEEGNFPPETIHAKVMARLRAFAHHKSHSASGKEAQPDNEPSD